VGWKTSGVVFGVLIIIFLNRRRGGSVSLSPRFWIWLGKCLQLMVLLTIFSALRNAGKILLTPAFILLFAPSFVLTQIVVPLGWPRFAYWAARCCGPVELVRESSAGAALYGALALMRKPRSMQAIDWLTQRANHTRSVRGAGVVTAGLLAALRGDRHRARCLLLLRML
jgi:hypothetical protein